MQTLTNRVIKSYAIRELIGTGGFGAVYRAYQQAVSREVAMKVILPDFANHPDFVRRFEVEAQMIARLEHPHIVPLYDYWRDPDGAYLVMRWLRGNLRQSIERGAWQLDAAARLLDQLAGALTVAHREGIVHRDIKPENILLDEDNNAYLADFGIAKNIHLRDVTPADSETLTGSPAYLSPEQIQSGEITSRSDLYSLGYVLYEILTREKPFPDASSPSDYFRKHLTTPLPMMSIQHSHIPAAIDEVLQTATAKDPTHRYPTALRFSAAFRAALPNRAPRIPAQPLASPLTDREFDVLRLMLEGLSNTEIAARLFFTPGTVKWYMKQIYSKLDVHSRQQAIDRAVNLRLLERFAIPSKADARAEDSATIIISAAAYVEPENPYKGLRAFQEADADDFFGRAALTERLLSRLSESGDELRFLAIVGASGSGKSSVVRAGLIPALRSGALTASPHPFIADFLPGTHPLEELESALLRVAVNPIPGLLNQLRDDRRGLVRAAKRLLPTDPETELILVIDQFEELFTLVTDEQMRTCFIDNLLSAVTDLRARVRVILTLRADFYDRPLLYPRLAELVRAHTEVIIPLTARELEQSITAPAERAGVRLEAGLVATILHDVAEQPGTLPLLQYALTELFERREGVTLTLDAYHALGGVLGAMTQRADVLYAQLDPASQEAAQQLFLRLVTLGDGTEDMRRRTLLSELTSLGEEGLVEDVINTFAQHRLLTFDRDPLIHTPTVEIAHEALIREWQTLHQWLSANREDVRIQRRLAEAAAEWNAGNDASFLASGIRLTQFETWAKDSDLALTAAERAYLDASLAEHARTVQLEQARQANEQRLERRSRNALRVLVVILLLATLGAFGLTGIALNQRQIADTNFRRAEAQRLYLASSEAMTNGASGNVGMALALRSLAYGYSAGADAALVRGTRQGVISQRLTGHANEIIDVQYSPDGTLIVTSGSDGTRVYNAETGDLRFVLPSQDSSNVGYALFHPSSKLLVTGRASGIVQFWDTATGEEIRRFTYDDGTNLIGLARGGDSLITFQWPRSVREWDTATGELLKSTELSADIYLFGTGQTTSPTIFTYVSEAYVLTLQSVETDAVTCRIEPQADLPVVNNAFMDPDDRTLIYQTGDYAMHVVDTATCAEIGLYTVHPGRLSWLVFSADGKTVYSSDTLGNIYHWEMYTGQVLGHYRGWNGSIYTIALAPDERHLVSVGFNSDAYVFDLTFPSEPRSYQTDLFETWRVYFAPDSQSIVAGGSNNAVRLDIHSGEVTQQYTSKAGIRDFMFSPDRASFFASSADPLAPDGFTNHLFDAATGEEIRAYAGHTDTVNHVAYSPDGTKVASGAWDGTARVWDAATGESLIVYTEHTDVVSHIAFSPDNKTILTTSGDGTARLWDADTGETLHVFEDGDGAIVMVGVFSPDGKFILTTNSHGFAYVWDVQTGERRYSLVGHKDAVWAGLFSPDGHMIATSGDGVRLWDAQTGVLIRALPAMNRGGESWPAFSPDGQLLAVGSQRDGQVLLWHVTLDAVIAEICARPWMDVTQEERAQYNIPGDEASCPPSQGE